MTEHLVYAEEPLPGQWEFYTLDDRYVTVTRDRYLYLLQLEAYFATDGSGASLDDGPVKWEVYKNMCVAKQAWEQQVRARLARRQARFLLH